MDERARELEAMKTEINLSAVAAACGFEVDRRSSSRNSVVMRHPDGEKIIVGNDAGHWVYWAVHGGHAGSVLDFVMHRQGKNLGEARRELRGWMTGGTFSPPTALPRTQYAERPEPVAKDVLAVRARYEAAQPLDRPHPYLNTTRCIPAALTASGRFAGRVRIDGRGNVLFPHWNQDGLCGFEVKNHGFTGFAPGGTKGLWGSHIRDTDRRLVIAETAIDALSYAALFDDGRTRYVSTAGKMNPHQPELIARAVVKLPPCEAELVAAVDHDAGGTAIAKDLLAAVQEVAAMGVRYLVDRPERSGSDWNDVLREQAGDAPNQATEPSPD
ncbi:MAG: toprim domain-containing protein [Planctomycetota bacterium]